MWVYNPRGVVRRSGDDAAFVALVEGLGKRDDGGEMRARDARQSLSHSSVHCVDRRRRLVPDAVVKSPGCRCLHPATLAGGRTRLEAGGIWGVARSSRPRSRAAARRRRGEHSNVL